MTRAARAQDPPTPAADPQDLEPAAAFTEFVSTAEPRLRRALVAAYGFEDGREATAEALAYAWENWDRLRLIDNLPGYLFRVGQSRRRRKREPVLFNIAEPAEHRFEPALPGALASLSQRQRLAVRRMDVRLRAKATVLKVKLPDHAGYVLITD